MGLGVHRSTGQYVQLASQFVLGLEITELYFQYVLVINLIRFYNSKVINSGTEFVSNLKAISMRRL